MANNVSLHSLLDSDKLIKPNFDSWYRKLKMILGHERIFYVITGPAPKEPAPNAHSAVRDTYQKWLNDQVIVRCIMRMAMNNKFSRKFEDAQ